MNFLDSILLAHILELLLSEGHFDSERAEKIHGQILISGRIGVVDHILDDIPHHIGNINTYALAKECVMTAVIDVGTLLVHHIIVLQETLTDTEVILLNTLLSISYSVGDHTALYALPFLKSECIEHLHDTVGGEEAHQLILE